MHVFLLVMKASTRGRYVSKKMKFADWETFQDSSRKDSHMFEFVSLPLSLLGYPQVRTYLQKW